VGRSRHAVRPCVFWSCGSTEAGLSLSPECRVCPSSIPIAPSFATFDSALALLLYFESPPPTKKTVRVQVRARRKNETDQDLTHSVSPPQTIKQIFHSRCCLLTHSVYLRLRLLLLQRKRVKDVIRKHRKSVPDARLYGIVVPIVRDRIGRNINRYVIQNIRCINMIFIRMHLIRLLTNIT